MKAARTLSAVAAFGALAFTATASFAETRTLKIYHVHLNERSTITFKRDGRYLPDGLNKLNYALRDWRRNEPTKMDPRLFDLIWEVYQKTGTNQYINVIGGYRSPATNSMLRKRSNGVAEKSQHIRGKAMDFYIPGIPLKQLRYTGLRMQVGGVGYYPTSGSPFVHMDVGNVRHWPRMSRKELMAVFPDGKTIHVPSDGKPLAGYDVALAAYESRKARGSSGALFASAGASGSSGKKRTLFAALFGGGADEEEDTGGGEEVAVAAAQPKPVKKQAAPIEPLPLPEAPAPQAIVATLPRREQADGIEPPRPDANVGDAAAGEALAFAVPVPNKKPRFAAVQQAEPVAAQPVDPDAEAAAIKAVLGQDAQPQAEAAVAADEPFIDGVVPVPGKKPQVAEVEMASLAVPTPRPEIAAEDAIAASDDAEAVAEDAADVPAPAARPDDIAKMASAEPAADAGDEQVVASVGAAKPAASMRSTMLEDASAEAVDTGVKTTGKGSKPKARDARPGLKAVSTAPTPKVGKFALNSAPVAIENQPVAPEYAQALVRAAPKEVYVAGFTKDGPLPADKFTGKSVNFLRIAKFSTE